MGVNIYPLNRGIYLPQKDSPHMFDREIWVPGIKQKNEEKNSYA